MSLLNDTVMDTVTEQVFLFGAWDYTVFGVMLAVSTAIGIYLDFLLTPKTQQTSIFWVAKR